MKKTILTSLVLGALMAGNAMAADMRVKAPVMKAPPAPAYSWTGCYLDAGVGYGLWNQEESESAFGLTTATYTNGGRGWLGRFGGGCDIQVSGSNFVIGALADYDVMDLKGTNTQAANFTALGAGGPPVGAEEKESSAWYVGGRIGYLVTPNLLSYVNGGWSETRFDQRNFFLLLTGASAVVSAPQHTFSGWFIGGGVEYALNLPFIP